MPAPTLAPRLARLPLVTVLEREVRLAQGFRARLEGLARLERAEAGAGLLIRNCSCVHTLGMRFHLDLHFLAAAGAVVDSRLAVPPNRVAFCGTASAVLELPSEPGGEFGRPRA